MEQLSKASKSYSSFFGIYVSAILFFLIVWGVYLVLNSTPFPQKDLLLVVGIALSLFSGYVAVRLVNAILKRRKAFLQGVDGTAEVVSFQSRYGTVGVCKLKLVHNSQKFIIEDNFISTLYKGIVPGKVFEVRFLENDPNVFVIKNL